MSKKGFSTWLVLTVVLVAYVILVFISWALVAALSADRENVYVSANELWEYRDIASDALLLDSSTSVVESDDFSSDMRSLLKASVKGCIDFDREIQTSNGKEIDYCSGFSSDTLPMPILGDIGKVKVFT